MGRRSGEFEMIERLLAPLAGEAGFHLTDDAAMLPKLEHGACWVATKDAMVAGVHFLPDDPPDLVARKLIRVNLSDLAAMGAVPKGYLLAAALTEAQDDDWMRRFADGLRDDQALYGIELFGGDTVSTPGPLTLSLTALGQGPRGRLLRRSGAAAGDDVYVSGTLGDAAFGLLVCRGELELEAADARFLAKRFQLPEPRAALGPLLIGAASACLDVSDGLVADLGHIAACSGVGIEIELEAMPLTDAVRHAMAARPELAELPLSGGDDYELAFTAPPGRADAVRDAAELSGTAVHRIGRVVEGEGVTVLSEGRPLRLERQGWQHF